MAQNKRARLEPHIEEYLKSQAERVLGKPADQLTAAELSTLTNSIIYEHKLAQAMARQIPLARLVNWLTSLVPGSGNKVVALQPPAESLALKEPETLDFEADFADQFEVDLAA